MEINIEILAAKPPSYQFKVNEVAVYCNLSRTTIFRMTKDFEIPFIPYGKKSRRYLKASIDEWLKKRTIHSKDFARDFR